MSKRYSRGGLLAAAALAFLIIPAASASAAPATITSATAVNRHLQVTWTLPAGMESFAMVASASPATDVDGFLLSSNLGLSEVVAPSATSATTMQQAAAGTYHVQVIAYDPNTCFPSDDYCVDEASAVSQIEVPADPVIAPPVAAPPVVTSPPPTVKKKSTKCKKGKVRKHGKCVKKKKKKKKH